MFCKLLNIKGINPNCRTWGGYFVFAQAKPDTRLSAGNLVEVWYPSKYEFLDKRTVIQISALDATAAYEELLKMAEIGSLTPETSTTELDKVFKGRELRPAHTLSADPNLSLRDLSLKYYRDPRFWKIIKAMNKPIPSSAGEDWRPQQGEAVYVYYFLPPV